MVVVVLRSCWRGVTMNIIIIITKAITNTRGGGPRLPPCQQSRASPEIFLF